MVTGASNGIGEAIVNVFLENGAKVVGLDIVDKESNRSDLIYKTVNVADTSDCKRVYQEIIKIYDQIDILVNCAGITRDALTEKMSEEQWDNVIDVNLKGVWNLTRLVGPAMQKNKRGSIINISSIVVI